MARPDVRYATPEFNFETERNQIDGSFAKLQGAVDDFDGLKPEVRRRVKSRVNHLRGRFGSMRYGWRFVIGCRILTRVLHFSSPLWPVYSGD